MSHSEPGRLGDHPAPHATPAGPLAAPPDHEPAAARLDDAWENWQAAWIDLGGEG